MLGFKIQAFKIMPVGFMVSFRIDTKNYNKKILNGSLLSLKKLIVAIAGPLTNVVFILLFILYGKEKILNIETQNLIYANMLIFIFNMLPIYPLDGGRILKNVLHIFFGKILSLKLINFTSNTLVIILSVIVLYISFRFKNIAYIFVLTYIWIIRIREDKIYKMKIKMYKILKKYIEINQK